MSREPSKLATAFSRREFLRTSALGTGGLVLAVHLAGCSRTDSVAKQPVVVTPNAWLRIGTDDSCK